MNFISYSYLVLFSVVFLCRLTIGRDKTERPYVAVLLLASVLFYSWHIPRFIFLLLASASIDYAAALYMGKAQSGRPDRHEGRFSTWRPSQGLVLGLSVAVNLGLLVYYKYTDFLLESAKAALDAFGFPTRLHAFGVVLPLGISFYTFASLSYTIDVYRRDFQPTRRFWKFFLFISFFPHLVAGPIVRASMFLPQVARRRRLWLPVFNQGCFLIIRGFFMKMVLGDNLAKFVNDHWSEGYASGTDSRRLGVLSVCLLVQIFCDFEGYTSIAQGTAYLLGYRLPQNFNNPFLATSFKNYWERWHITLGLWMRDYVYRPMGGNRCSAFRAAFNTIVAMTLVGLWHGASMNFVVWGFLHGVILCIERVVGMNRPGHGQWAGLRRLAWYPVVHLTWFGVTIIFRSDTLEHGWRFLSNIAARRLTLAPLDSLDWAPFLAVVAVMHVRGALVEHGLAPACGPREKGILAAFMLFCTFIYYGTSSVFVYFQF